MGAGDDSTFFLYGMGERPEALTLGSLVLEKYWQPMIARHYTHELMSEDALREHAYTSDVTNAVFHGHSRLTPSIGLEGGDIAHLSLAYNKDLERIVIADKGTRVLLKDPEQFLTENVLSNAIAQEKLKLWLSAAYSAYVLNFKFARRPKVWLLTGLYLLEGARTVVSRGSSSKVSVGVSSAIIGAVSGVPVGGSVSLGVGSTWEMAMQVAEPHVWAAQYRLVDARFIKAGKGDDVKLPVSMGLYRDVMSVNTARGGEGRTVELGLGEEQYQPERRQAGEEEDDDDDSGVVEDDQEGLEVEEYEKRLEQAIGLFEKAPKHFLH
ncbi:uncharacterized protein N7483_000835 [Penicillium malachiteum]|uniref:uncharacterized protein n=1 Tax=Penicillium malachiteum TaxID=1324776 RepID=UPI002546740B|nr:uncharacterized protein N7483_000835 [Penicillium malachiteum]KAJ5735710.1 hypothetical protein N7483_000835 [Penicillium malachiteum]